MHQNVLRPLLAGASRSSADAHSRAVAAAASGAIPTRVKGSNLRNGRSKPDTRDGDASASTSAAALHQLLASAMTVPRAGEPDTPDAQSVARSNADTHALLRKFLEQASIYVCI
jgi:hypothetical protein